MKITCISDTHNRHEELELPGGDILIHAGDFAGGFHPGPTIHFIDWLSSQDYTHKIFIAGNHDQIFEDDLGRAQMQQYIDCFHENVHYLEDSSVEIDGIKFYGSPYTPAFMNWGFQLHTLDESEAKWSEIPEDTSVLITHGPAIGHLDQVYGKGQSLGCPSLLKHIRRVKPKYHICGHIHSGQGMMRSHGTRFINAACLGEDYRYSNKQDYTEFTIK